MNGRDLTARYRSLFEIGRGGMGTIEVALEKNAHGFERIVALKRLHPQSAREQRQTEAFVREARLAVWLVHPNVVHAFDFGEIDGELFLALEYVEGETLSAMVRMARERSGAPLPPAVVARILADACDGLHAAHELRDPTSGAPLNVIHRDVSPHNVMVSYEGHVKLLDFGVAKMDAVDPLTRTGEVKGKTAYMSPEQAMGDPLDRRSDLFSLGAVLFECVAGRRMWGGGTDLEVMRKLALESPPSLADAAPLAPPALVDLCARLVARSREDRPATAREVSAELRAFAVESTPSSPSDVATLMQTLFAAEASERRASLDKALTKAEPTARLDVLRRSLAGPTALASLSPPGAPTPASTARRDERAVAPARATRRGIVVSAVLGMGIAVAVVGVTSTHSASEPPTPPTSTSTSTSTSAPTPTPSSTPTATPIPIPPKADPNEKGDTRTDANVTPSHPHRSKPGAPKPNLDVDTNPL